MLEFLKTYMLDIIIFIVILIVLIILYKRGKKELVKKIILGLVVQAEKILGSGTGELKYATVVKAFYSIIPISLRLLFTTKDVDKYIEDGVSKLKEILDTGKTLVGYDNELIVNSKINKDDTLK